MNITLMRLNNLDTIAQDALVDEKNAIIRQIFLAPMQEVRRIRSLLNLISNPHRQWLQVIIQQKQSTFPQHQASFRDQIKTLQEKIIKLQSWKYSLVLVFVTTIIAIGGFIYLNKSFTQTSTLEKFNCTCNNNSIDSSPKSEKNPIAPIVFLLTCVVFWAYSMCCCSCCGFKGYINKDIQQYERRVEQLRSNLF